MFFSQKYFRVENRRRKTTDQMKEFNSGGSINYIVITCKEDIHLVIDVLSPKLEFLLLLVVVVLKLAYLDKQLETPLL